MEKEKKAEINETINKKKYIENQQNNIENKSQILENINQINTSIQVEKGEKAQNSGLSGKRDCAILESLPTLTE